MQADTFVTVGVTGSETPKSLFPLLCWFDLMICCREAHDMRVLMMLRRMVTALDTMLIFVSVERPDNWSAAIAAVMLVVVNGAVGC
jgi:hypothetical protein